MIEDLLLWMKTPFGEEIYLSLLLPLISSVLTLWGLSKIFKFKKNSFLVALLVGSSYVIAEFLIRLNSLLFNLTDIQKPFINKIGMIVSIIVLIILLTKIYKANWWKTIICWLSVFCGKLMFIGVVMIMMMFFIPTFSEYDSAPIAKVGMTDFSINEVGNNYFKVYRSELVTPTGILAINLDSSIAFNSRVEGVSMDLECNSQEGKFIKSIEDKIERYEFTSIPQDNLDVEIVAGYAHFDCDVICPKDRTTFNLRGLFDENVEYSTKSELAEMNTGEFSGTEILYVERRKPIGINIDFALSGEDNATLNCEVIITSKIPKQIIKKSFTIEYIAN